MNTETLQSGWTDVDRRVGYQVHRSGAVRSSVIIGGDLSAVRTGGKWRILKPWRTRTGYRLVIMGQSGGRRQTSTVHRLVAKAFIPNPLGLPQVNHLDGNKENNSAANLEWATSSGNHLHAARVLGLNAGEAHYRTALTWNDVWDIRAIYSFGATQAALASAYCMTASNVGCIVNRVSWTHCNGVRQ